MREAVLCGGMREAVVSKLKNSKTTMLVLRMLSVAATVVTRFVARIAMFVLVVVAVVGGVVVHGVLMCVVIVVAAIVVGASIAMVVVAVVVVVVVAVVAGGVAAATAADAVHTATAAIAVAIVSKCWIRSVPWCITW